ncbi:Uncharacterized protein Rs2_38620 [Raphanus sativus]|nr:Uncharacterized protein Rs2_38620 [Raphanus sativus]
MNSLCLSRDHQFNPLTLNSDSLTAYQQRTTRFDSSKEFEASCVLKGDLYFSGENLNKISKDENVFSRLLYMEVVEGDHIYSWRKAYICSHHGEEAVTALGSRVDRLEK